MVDITFTPKEGGGQGAAPITFTPVGAAKQPSLEELSKPGRDAVQDPLGNMTSDPTGLVGTAKGIAYLPRSVEEHRDKIRELRSSGASPAQLHEAERDNPAYNFLFGMAAGPLAAKALGGVPSAIEGAAKIPKHIIDFGDNLAGNNAAATERYIDKLYQKTIKPSTKGISTSDQLDHYHAQARDAISSIVENKEDLQFVDRSSGEATKGELPQSLEQFGDAIGQTKEKIFRQYDDLAKQTQTAGIEVGLRPAVVELQRIANDSVVTVMHPELTKYARDTANRLSSVGRLSATDTQRVITGLNQSLKAFYDNPTYESAARANVDAMIANNLRESLDKTVESAVGPGYQELKNKYGALKAIEKHVVNRAQTVGRQDKSGLLSGIGSIVSAEEVIRGVMSLRPGIVAQGLALKGVVETIKHLRNPNRAVTKMFEAAERAGKRTSPSPIPTAGASSLPVPASILGDESIRNYGFPRLTGGQQ